MQKNKITAGIIGLGKIGLLYDLSQNRNILTYSKSLYKSKSFELLFGADKNNKKLNIFYKKYKKEIFKDYKIAVKRLKPDLIVICCDTKFHYVVFKNIVSFYKPKAIIFEKPFTSKFRHANEIYKFCKFKNIILYVNYIRSLNPILLGLKKKYLNNKKTFNFTFNYSGEFLNNGSHFIDLMLYLKGSPKKYEILKKRKKFIDVKFFYKNGSVELRNVNLNANLDKIKENYCYLKNSNDSYFLNNKYFKYGNKKISLDLKNYQKNLLKLIYKDINCNIKNNNHALRAVSVLKLINEIEIKAEKKKYF
jgi:predicted dehydrogenase